MSPRLLDLSEIDALIAGETAEQSAAPTATAPPPLRISTSGVLVPLETVADSLVQLYRNTEGRWLWHITELDALMRGVGRGELCFLTGRAHSGKTQVLLHSLVCNPRKRVLYVSADETAEAVLAKMVALTNETLDGLSLESGIQAGDPEVIGHVKHVARRDFANMFVVDTALSIPEIDRTLTEAEDLWGAPCDLLAIDYLELLPSDEDEQISSVIAKSRALKAVVRDHNVPTICLRQNSRSSGPRGQAAGMDGMGYGGEDTAIYVVEVYRKRDDQSLGDADREYHAETITINLAKNKRPPMRRGEVTMRMEPRTGALRAVK